MIAKSTVLYIYRNTNIINLLFVVVNCDSITIFSQFFTLLIFVRITKNTTIVINIRIFDIINKKK